MMTRYLIDTRCKRPIACLVIVIIFGPGSALAGTMKIDYSLGFGGQFRLNHWTPLTVTLDNKGRRFQGSLEVRASTGSEYTASVETDTYATEVELDARSSKSYAFTVFIESFVHPFIIRVRNGTRIVERLEVNLRNHLTEHPIIPVLGDKIEIRFLNGFPDNVSPGFTNVKHLPKTWIGYEAIPMVLMPVSKLGQLSSRQYTALVDWISIGGVLVLNSDLNYGGFLNPAVRRLFKPSVKEIKTLTSYESIAEFGESPIAATEASFVLDLRIDGATPFLQERDISLILQKTIGAGTLYFLTFDYQLPFFKQWNGRSVFWRKLMSAHPVVPRATQIDHREIVNTLAAGIKATFIDLGQVLILCVIYIVFLGAILLFYNHKTLSIRGAIFSLLGVMTGFTVVAAGIYYSQAKQDRLIAITYKRIFTRDRFPKALVSEIEGLYTFSNRHFERQFDEQSRVIRLSKTGSPRNRQGTALAYTSRKNAVFISMEMKRWGQYIFHTTSLGLKLAEGRFLSRKGDIYFELTNNYPTAIEHGELFIGRKHWPVGTVNSGERIMIKLTRGIDLGFPSTLFGVYLDKPDDDHDGEDTLYRTRFNLAMNILKNKTLKNHSDSSVRFMGWMPPDQGIGPPVSPSHGVTLLEMVWNSDSALNSNLANLSE